MGQVGHSVSCITKNKGRLKKEPALGIGVNKGLLSHVELEAFDFVPFAAGEVGHHDGHGTVVDGHFGELHEAAPLGGVIDVLVQREAVVQAVDEAGVHDEVHTAEYRDEMDWLQRLFFHETLY